MLLLKVPEGRTHCLAAAHGAQRHGRGRLPVDLRRRGRVMVLVRRQPLLQIRLVLLAALMLVRVPMQLMQSLKLSTLRVDHACSTVSRCLSSINLRSLNGVTLGRSVTRYCPMLEAWSSMRLK